MVVFFLISVFRLYQGLQMWFEHNSVRKNLFLSACFCWDSGLSLREMYQKFKFGGLIGYGSSYLDSVFRYSKVFTLHAILHVCCWSSSITYWQRTWLLLHDWTRTKFMFAWSRDWTTLLPLRINLSTLHFQLCWLLKQHVFDCARYTANWEKHH